MREDTVLSTCQMPFSLASVWAANSTRWPAAKLVTPSMPALSQPGGGGRKALGPRAWVRVRAVGAMTMFFHCSADPERENGMSLIKVVASETAPLLGVPIGWPLRVWGVPIWIGMPCASNSHAVTVLVSDARLKV